MKESIFCRKVHCGGKEHPAIRSRSQGLSRRRIGKHAANNSKRAETILIQRYSGSLKWKRLGLEITDRGFWTSLCRLEYAKNDSIELLRAIRKDVALSELPVVMLTVRKKKEYLQEALDAGVSGYIVKPFTQEAFDDRLPKIFKSEPLCRPEKFSSPLHFANTRRLLTSQRLKHHD